MVDYATVEREEWTVLSGPTPDARYLWGELAKYGHKSSYFPEAHRGFHFQATAGEYPKIASLADKSIDRLRQCYEFRGDGTVADFLEKNPSLFSLLEDAHDETRRYFGSEVQLALKVVKDPEVANDQRLFVLIQTDMLPEDALDRLDELYDEWWLDALLSANHKMSIDVEYL